MDLEKFAMSCFLTTFPGDSAGEMIMVIVLSGFDLPDSYMCNISFSIASLYTFRYAGSVVPSKIENIRAIIKP